MVKVVVMAEGFSFFILLHSPPPKKPEPDLNPVMCTRAEALCCPRSSLAQIQQKTPLAPAAVNDSQW